MKETVRLPNAREGTDERSLTLKDMGSMRASSRLLPLALVLSVACGTGPPAAHVVSGETVVAKHDRLPTGARLDPIDALRHE